VTRLAIGLLVLAAAVSACTRSNDVLLGRVEATVGSNPVLVTDCYRTSVPAPERLPDEGGRPAYRFAPCRDAVVLIGRGELVVNGKPYGPIGPKDAVLVDHGVVSITREK
jgi:hypothetical protein